VRDVESSQASILNTYVSSVGEAINESNLPSQMERLYDTTDYNHGI